jgi:hypothetical protein
MKEVTCVHNHHFTSTMDHATSAEGPSDSTEDIYIDPGYVYATTEDGRRCLMPQFLFEEYELKLKSLNNAKEMHVAQASGGVSGYCCPWTCSFLSFQLEPNLSIMLPHVWHAGYEFPVHVAAGVLPGCVAGMCCRDVLPGCVAGMCCRDVLPGCVAGMCCRFLPVCCWCALPLSVHLLFLRLLPAIAHF